MDTSDEEFVTLCLVLEEEEIMRKKNKKRKWVHDINLKRSECGEFHHLFPDLLKDNQKFFKYFRMSNEKFYDLLKILDIQKQDTAFRKAISAEEKLALTLKFLGHGDSFVSLSFSYRLGESTVRGIIYEVCAEIWSKLHPVVMPPPTTEQWHKIETDFRTKWNYPNCIGALDGKHVVMEKPPNSGSNYFNYKKEFSVVLMALVDADLRFITVDIGAYGKNSDGGIFKKSALGKNLNAGTLKIPGPKRLPGSNIVTPHVIVGDEAFPLCENLMRPYPGIQLRNNHLKKIYNYRHSRARRCSENAFGLLSKKIRIFLKKFNISPKNLDYIIMAATCLHNYLRNDKCYWQPGELEENEVQHGLGRINNIGGNSARNVMNIRDRFAEYFNMPEGRVSWQEEQIQRGRRNLLCDM